jgi:iron(III) transport system substrate-binding protein
VDLRDDVARLIWMEGHTVDRLSGQPRSLTRRQALKLGMSSGVAVALAACGGTTPAASTSSPTSAQATSDPLATLVSAAKAEGTLTWYTAVPPPAITPLLKAFTDKYGVKVDFNRQTSGTLGTLLKTEVESGKVIVDVIEMGDVVTMKRAADSGWLLNPSTSEMPSLSGWPGKWAHVSNGATYPQAIAVYSISYNTQLVGADVPKEWSALTNSKWRGKIILGDPRASTQFLDFFRLLHAQYGDAFLRALRDQNPQYTTSLVTGINSVGSGDAAMIGPGAHWINTDLIARGAPIADAYPLPAMSGSEQWIGLVKNGPHPNAGKLFFNFALSQDGQLATCKDLCSSVLNPTGTLPFPATYVSPDLDAAVARKAALLGLLGLQ